MRRTVTLRSWAPDGDTGDGEGELTPFSPLLRKRRREDGYSTIQAVRDECKDRWTQIWEFVTSKTGQGILKCSIAYVLGSMATFVPVISDLLGQQDGKHMVATVTVYFHPARSQGSMFEAVGLAVLAFIYAAFISFTSMGVSIFVGRTLDLIVVGHIVVLIVFCGGGLGFVGWTKQRLLNPLVNVACSLTSLAIITVLTKEGAVQEAEFSDDKVVQVMIMIIMGVVAATAVCFLVRPVSARKELKENMINVTDSFGDMLAMITRSFLMGVEEESEQRAFVAKSDRYRTLHTSLVKNLREAKFEHYVFGTEAEYQLESKLVKCLQRMAQNIGGLRSAATTQFDLLSQTPSYGGTTPSVSIHTPLNPPNLSVADSWISNPETYRVLAAIDENTEEELIEEPLEESQPSMRSSIDLQSSLPTVRSPVDIFERFISHLGPSMVSFCVVR